MVNPRDVPPSHEVRLPDPVLVLGWRPTMPLFRWLRDLFRSEQAPSAAPSRRAPPPPFDDGWGYLGAVGESRYQPALRRVAGMGRLCWAMLVPEPDNPFDSNAVMVKIDGETVGYLSRADARRYQRRLVALVEPPEVPAKLIGGECGKPSYGVLLDCRQVEQLPKPKPVRRKQPAADPNEPFQLPGVEREPGPRSWPRDVVRRQGRVCKGGSDPRLLRLVSGLGQAVAKR